MRDSNASGAHFKTDEPNGAAVVALNNPAGAQKLVLKLGMIEAANDWWWAVDNLTVGQLPMLTATVGRGDGFACRLLESAEVATVDTATLTARLDGQAVTVTTDRPYNEIQLEEVEVRHDQSPKIFAPGSLHTVEVSFRTSDGRSLVEKGSFVAPGYSTVRATPLAFTVTIAETSYLTVDESKGIPLVWNGQAITPTSVLRQDLLAPDGSDAPDRLLVDYRVPAPMASGSQHSLIVGFTTATAQYVEQTLSFRVPVYGTIPGELATARGTGSKAGLRWSTHQIASGRPLGNSIAGAEAQLRGEYGPSLHDPSSEVAGGYFEVPFVNFDQNAGPAGHFRYDSLVSGQEVADELIPGIPGLENGRDNIACEARAFIEFPAPGVYTMVVNSDDGFQLSTGNTNNPVYLVLGKWDSGRGAADSEVYFQVAQAGVYFFRLLYFEGGGDARVEWFTVDAAGKRMLINGTEAGALKAFEQRTVAEPGLPIPTLSVKRDGAAIVIDFAGTLQSAEQAAGGYSDVAGAASPYTVPTGAATMRFYRTRQ
jgi:hypothetical protein